jgi:hypothetical protein
LTTFQDYICFGSFSQKSGFAFVLWIGNFHLLALVETKPVADVSMELKRKKLALDEGPDFFSINERCLME